MLGYCVRYLYKAVAPMETCFKLGTITPMLDVIKPTNKTKYYRKRMNIVTLYPSKYGSKFP